MPRSVCCFSCFFFFFSARVFWLPPEMAWITISVGSSEGRVARIPESDCGRDGGGRGRKKRESKRGTIWTLAYCCWEKPRVMCVYIIYTYIISVYKYIYIIINHNKLLFVLLLLIMYIVYIYDIWLLYITYIYHIIYHISVMWFICGVQMVSRWFPNQKGISSHFEELVHAVVEACEFPSNMECHGEVTPPWLCQRLEDLPPWFTIDT